MLRFFMKLSFALVRYEDLYLMNYPLPFRYSPLFCALAKLTRIAPTELFTLLGSRELLGVPETEGLPI